MRTPREKMQVGARFTYQNPDMSSTRYILFSNSPIAAERRFAHPRFDAEAAVDLPRETIAPQGRVQKVTHPVPGVDRSQGMNEVGSDVVLARRPYDEWTLLLPEFGRLAEGAGLAVEFNCTLRGQE